MTLKQQIDELKASYPDAKEAITLAVRYVLDDIEQRLTEFNRKQAELAQKRKASRSAGSAATGTEESQQ